MRDRTARSAKAVHAMCAEREHSLPNHRRTFLRASLGALGTLALARGTTAAAIRERRPNILFILADDLGYGDVSAFGCPDYETPAIDQLCRDGVKLRQGYANSSTCSPTRVALLSGQYQHRFPVGLYDPLPVSKDLGFPTDVPTLPSILKNMGYRTALVGKWHLGRLPKYGPLKSGYEEFFGLMGAEMDHFTHLARQSVGGEPAPALYEGERPVEIEGYSTDLFTERAVAFVRRQGAAQPFFLSLHYTAPHWPWQGPTDRNVLKRDNTHFDGGSRRVFASMVRAMDAGIARVLDALRATGAEDDTIVVFTSDNGGERFSYSWPLRGEKFELWEGGIRVPTIVKWPRRIARGSVSDQVALSMDWLPTLVTAAGGGARIEHTDGIDLMSALEDPAKSRERTVFWRTNDMGAARRGRWKYVKDGAYEFLFDLVEDEREYANRKLRNPDLFASLREAYERWSSTILPIPEDAKGGRARIKSSQALDTPAPTAQRERTQP